MLRVDELIKKFKLKVVNEGAETNREIDGSGIQRLGLELLNAIKITDDKNVIGWGTRESKYLSSLNEENCKKALRNVLSENTPLVILSMGVRENVVEVIKQVCSEYKIPLVVSKNHLATIITVIGWHIVKTLTKSTSVHGSLVIVNGIGVMIIGKSGIGKSEAVLELIQSGSLFVSDDTVVLKRIADDFIGEADPLTKDFLEARGIGLINIPKIYGYKSTKSQVKIDLVVELVNSSKVPDIDRLGNKELKYEIPEEGEIPMVQIPVMNGRSLSSLIKAAVNVYMGRMYGHDPLKVIAERRK